MTDYVLSDKLSSPALNFSTAKHSVILLRSRSHLTRGQMHIGSLLEMVGVTPAL